MVQKPFCIFRGFRGSRCFKHSCNLPRSLNARRSHFVHQVRRFELTWITSSYLTPTFEPGELQELANDGQIHIGTETPGIKLKLSGKTIPARVILAGICYLEVTFPVFAYSISSYSISSGLRFLLSISLKYFTVPTFNSSVDASSQTIIPFGCI